MSDPNERRKYSINEIDAMRAAINQRLSYSGNSYRQSERDAQIEGMLRTHMLNGTSVEELKSAANEASKAYFRQQEEVQKYYRDMQEQHAKQFPKRPRPDGVMECLRVEDKRAKANDHGGYRCSSCNSMQKAGEFIVWVPDGIRMGERAESIVNSVRANQFNGGSSGWCLDCARRLTRKAGPVPARSDGESDA